MNIHINMLDIGKKLQFPLDGSVLCLREPGAEARDLLEKSVLEGQEHVTYILDFSDIQIVDTSFLDETVVEMTFRCQTHMYKDRLIAVSNISDVIRDNLHSAILLRQDKKKQKVPVAEIEKNDELSIIPGLEESLWPVLKTAYDKKFSLTAIELAERENIELNAASNRLKRLYDYGLLHRDVELVGNGKRYVFFPIGT